MNRFEAICELCLRLYQTGSEKTNNLGFDQVRHKPGCTVSEAGYKLEISDLRRRRIIVLSVQRKQRR